MFQRHNYKAIKVLMQRKAPPKHLSSILSLNLPDLLLICNMIDLSYVRLEDRIRSRE